VIQEKSCGGETFALDSSAYNYDPEDGTFIHYYGSGSWGVLYCPDGDRQVDFGIVKFLAILGSSARINRSGGQNCCQ
jgi:hypothetical protein